MWKQGCEFAKSLLVWKPVLVQNTSKLWTLETTEKGIFSEVGDIMSTTVYVFEITNISMHIQRL